MKSTIEDICEKLRGHEYKNEEHIRLSLVARILQEMGWDIWNPKEVFTEFPAIKAEDNTKVDVALFSKPNLSETKFPDVYIEIKSHTRIEQNLPAVEKQLRDYNRNNQATFTIITDGQAWLFYYSLAQGEFSDRRYHQIDLLADNNQQTEDAFIMFLSKENITNGQAKNWAEEYLRLSHKERAIRDSIPEATKRMDTNPLLNKVQAIQEVLSDKGFLATDEEIIIIIKKDSGQIQGVTPVTKQQFLNPKQNIPATPVSIQNKESSTTTVLKVSANGRDFQFKDALDTFKEILRHWGVERIMRNTTIKCKHPLLVAKEDLKGLPHQKYSPIEGDFYVYSNTSTFRKKQFLDIISNQLNEQVSIEIIPK